MGNCFVDENKEYLIKDMFPKRPWMNYAWNEEYVSTFSQFGFGISRYCDKNGLLRNILRDGDNRLVFVKDETDKEYWAINRNYDKKPFDVFETNVGMGYSKINSEYKGIATTLKMFVPTKGLFECWEIEISNTSDEDREISLYSYAAINMLVTNFSACSEAHFEKSLNGVYCSHRGYNSHTDLECVFFCANKNVASYETTDRRFRGVYSDIGHPIALNEEKLTGEDTCFDVPICSALQFRLSLKRHAKEKILFVLGACKNEDEAKSICDSMLNEASFIKEFDAVTKKIDDFQQRVMIKTPDTEIDSRINIWLKRQIELGKQWGRMYGKGFRDLMQDIAGYLSLDPKSARERILYCLQYQREDGNPIRQWDPYEPKVYVDGAVWLFFTLNAYLKETNDFSILEDKVKYYESEIEETVLEHCLRGMNYLQTNLGEHGLNLWGDGDWNDSLNGCGVLGKGESLWLSEAVILAVKNFREILIASGNERLIGDMVEKAEKMKEDIFKYGWDKDHFIYGINDYGEKVGSYDTEEGQIYLNSQVWAVLAGIVEGEDAKKLMQTVEEKLGCKYGYVVQYPSYTKGSDKIGRSSYFKPGCYENGSVYNHGVAFKIGADCMVYGGDKALDTIYRILPVNPHNTYEDSGVEPYAMTNMYLGPECSSRRGESLINWITGTCGWVYRGVIENIIGVKPEFNGLKIEPCLPQKWDKVTVKRVFRGCTYNIEIINENTKDEFNIFVDGEKINGNILPVFEDDNEHTVVCK